MQIMFFISEQNGIIIAALGAILTAISILAAFAIFQADTPRKKKRYTLYFVTLCIIFVIAIVAVVIIHFRVINYCEVPETTGVETATVDDTFLRVGSIVPFGAYEQDCIQSNGKETIEWLVLDIQDDKALLLSYFALDSQPYNTEYGATTWEDCSLHSWLKDVFMENAFSAEELEIIRLTEVDNSEAQSNRDWDVAGCANTDDMIFLLSYADTDRYFDNEVTRVCTPTDYAVSMGADVRTLDDGITDAAWWWLRSPGESNSQASFVNFDGTRYTNAVGNEYLSVRPALWIDLDKYISYINAQQVNNN